MIRALALVLSLVWTWPAIPAAADGPLVLLGIVVAVDEDLGTLTLQHGDGTGSHWHATAALLREVQVGDPVQAVVEGRVVRWLRALEAAGGEPGRQNRALQAR